MTVRRLLFAAGALAGLALVVSPSLRKRVLDALFGAEEEFEYSSTTRSPAMAGGLPGEGDEEY